MRLGASSRAVGSSGGGAAPAANPNPQQRQSAVGNSGGGGSGSGSNSGGGGGGTPSAAAASERDEPYFVRRRGAQLPDDLRLSGREFEAVDWGESVLLNLVLQSRYQLTVVACG